VSRLPLIQLRGRLIGALVLTSAVTLLVAATALVPPLERRLRHESLEQLTATARSVRPAVERLPPRTIRRGSPALTVLARGLRRRTGAQVAVIDRRGATLVSTDPDAKSPRAVAGSALRRNRVSSLVASAGDQRVAEVAVPFTTGGRSFAVALRKGLKDTQLAVRVVRRALIPAAVAGLAVALLLGAVLATRLSGRLRRLRDTALRVARLGPEAEVPADAGRDEVGDLTRAFADMQERLREQEQARRTFVSTASHELRTPLASLQLMLGLLEEDLDSERPDLGDARDHVARAKAQTERLSSLAADLLDLSRVDARVPLRHEPVELVELCRSVAAEFEPRAEACDVRLEVSAPRSSWAYADPGSAARVLRLLLDNALRFAPPGSAVRMVVSPGGRRHEIAVCDEGEGVPPGEEELIFERFRRASSAGAKGGFGLGLALGRELARQMGGDLRLAASGRETRFAFSLEPAPAQDGGRPTAARAGAAHSR
jgi:signal transduction histidine kinase